MKLVRQPHSDAIRLYATTVNKALCFFLLLLLIHRNQVQGSNDWSIASKLSTVTAGYYKDSFISCFAQKPAKRSSLIHRGYYVRANAMHYIFEKFLSQYAKSQVA